MMVRSLAALLVASLTVVACSSAGEEEVIASGDQAISDGSMTVACRTLGRFDSCGSVSFCKEAHEESCQLKPTADQRFKQLCDSMAGNKRSCEFQSAVCDWQESSSCLPLGNAVQSDSQSGGDPIAVTCRTLGELGQCDASDLCRERDVTSCKAKPAVAAVDAKWQEFCPRVGFDQRACDFQSAFCQWETMTTCIGR